MSATWLGRGREGEGLSAGGRCPSVPAPVGRGGWDARPYGDGVIAQDASHAAGAVFDGEAVVGADEGGGVRRVEAVVVLCGGGKGRVMVHPVLTDQGGPSTASPIARRPLGEPGQSRPRLPALPGAPSARQGSELAMPVPFPAFTPRPAPAGLLDTYRRLRWCSRLRAPIGWRSRCRRRR